MDVGRIPRRCFEEEMDISNGRNGCFRKIYLAEVERVNWNSMDPLEGLQIVFSL